MSKKKLLIKKVDSEINTELSRYFAVKAETHVRVGEKGYFFPSRFSAGLNDIHNLAVRPDDVFVVTVPRSGTTWTQELVWLIANDYDFETAKSTPLTDRYPCMEISLYYRPEYIKALQSSFPIEDQQKLVGELGILSMERLLAANSRRFVKTHLPLSILPPELLNTAKVVYVARDPRDVCVSYYHFVLLMNKLCSFTGDFKDFWALFKRDLIFWTPYFAHVKEAWEKRNHRNILFLFYEELLQDMPSVIHRVANFFEKTVNDDQIQALCEHLKFDNFSNNKAVQLSGMEECGLLQKGEKFIRNGKAGGWREYFDYEMSLEADRWIAANLRDTDLRFPEVTTAGSEPKVDT